MHFRTPNSDSYLGLSKAKLRRAYLFLIFLLFILPINVAGGSRGALPIDLVISDFLCVIIALVYLFSFSPYSKHEHLFLFLFLFIFYSLLLAIFSTISTSDPTSLFSFSKFNKVILAFFAGYALSSWYGRDEVLRSLSNAACAYLFLLFVSQFVYHRDFLPRLGSDFFDFSVYGFPNSPSSYLVFVLCLAMLKSRHVILRWSLFLVASIFAVGSLSRAALVLVSLAIVLLSFEKARWRQNLIIAAAIGIGVIQFLPDITILTDVVTGVMKRLDRTMQTGDVSNGRFEIFRDTLDLISDKPIFGYGYVSYSNFGTHGTPHNQYLEVWFKTGLIGLLLYLVIIVLSAVRVWKSRMLLPEDLSLKSFYVMLVLVMIGNFVQPNLSYSPTGNLVFMAFGVFAILPRRVLSRQKDD